MKLLTAVILLAAVASAQDTPANPLVTVSKNMFAMTAKNDVLRSADKIPEALWSFQPVPTVRTVAQLFAHIADGQYEFCGLVTEGKSVSKNIENTQKTKALIVAALKDAFAYCDAAYAKLTDANASELVPFIGMRHGFQYGSHHGALRQPGHLHADQGHCAALERAAARGRQKAVASQCGAGTAMVGDAGEPNVISDQDLARKFRLAPVLFDQEGESSVRLVSPPRDSAVHNRRHRAAVEGASS